MKITDIIPLKKHTELSHVTWKDSVGNIHSYYNSSSAEKRAFTMHKYFYKVDIHSKDRCWLMNNVDKHIVVAYIEDTFTKIFLVKRGKNKFCGLTHVSNFELGCGGYSIFDFNTTGVERVLDLFKTYEDKVKIVDEDDFGMCKRQILLKKLESSND